MRQTFALLLLTSCAAMRPAQIETHLRRGYHFEGARRVAVIANEDDRRALEQFLIPAGFRVVGGMTDDESGGARYTLRIDGVCGFYGAAPTTLFIEVFDSVQNKKVFQAYNLVTRGCPDGFYQDAAAALAAAWPR